MQTTKTVAINVGGTRFESTRDTLDRSGFFQAALDRLADGQTLFVDRCPVAFGHVLRLLRNPNYAFPEEEAEELEFYAVHPEHMPKTFAKSASQILESMAKELKTLSQTVLTQHRDTATRLDNLYYRVDGTEDAVNELVRIKKLDWNDCRRCDSKAKDANSDYCESCFVAACCWAADAKLFVLRRGWTPAGNVVCGDRVRTPDGTYATVLEVRRSEPVPVKKMCLVDGTWFTRGHPVFVDGGWKLARDAGAEIVLVRDVMLYNLLLDRTHEVVFESGACAATLGRFSSDKDLS